MGTVRLETVDCCLCGGKSHEPLFSGKDTLGLSREEFSVVRCRSCGLVFLNPRPAGESLAVFYPDSYCAYDDVTIGREEIFASGGTGRDCFRDRVKRFILRDRYGYPCGEKARLIERLAALLWYPEFRRRFHMLLPFKENGSLLDIGCGRAGFLAVMKQLGWRVQGIEINRRCCDYARDKLGIPVFCGDPLESALPNVSFDVVRMWHFLEHHPRPEAVLGECRRLLKDDGALVIGIPNAASFEARALKEKSVLFDMPRHLYDFTPRTIRALLKKAGFRAYRVDYGPSLPSLDWSVNNHLKARGSRWRLSTDLRMSVLGIAFDGLLSLLRCSSVMTVFARKETR